MTYQDYLNAFSELKRELITLDYVLTWGYTDNYDKELARYQEIVKILNTSPTKPHKQ